MKHRYHLSLSLVFLTLMTGVRAFAQDTVVVQTLTFDSASRAGVYQFPPNDGTQFEKVILQYRMRCHGGLVSDQNNRNKGCGEWDYNCETFITDSSRVDSLRTTSPDYVVSNWGSGNFPFTAAKTYTLLRHDEASVKYRDSTAMEAHYYPPATGDISYPPLSNESGDNYSMRTLYLYPAGKLGTIGRLRSGRIYGMTFNLQSGSVGLLKRLHITLRNSTTTRISATNARDTGGVVVYDVTTPSLHAGRNTLYFATPFVWDSTANIIVDIGVDVADVRATIQGMNTPDTTGISAIANEKALSFSGSEAIPLPIPSNTLLNEVTISAWVYGDPTQLPGANTVLLEGLDPAGNRQLNVHLPWSDGQVYWDCGGDGSGGFDRISKSIDRPGSAGRWNHWAFTKNAISGRMNIYLNGQLFATDSGKHHPIRLHDLELGHALSSSIGYLGELSHFSMFTKALDSNQIRSLMMEDGPHANDSIMRFAAFDIPMQEGTGTIVHDSAVPNGSEKIVGTPVWRTVPGKDLYSNFQPQQFLPQIGFLENIVGDTAVIVHHYVFDTLEDASHSVIHYALGTIGLPVPLDTTYRYLAGKHYVLDENAKRVDSTNLAAADTVRIGQLVYFAKGPQKFEIMSFVTPYGIGLDLGKNGKLYEFDATDYLPILHGRKRLSMERGSGQEEFDLRFLFIKGRPVRDVLDIQQVWPMTEENYQTIMADGRYQPLGIKLSPAAKTFKLRSFITGHGQQGEFTPIDHYLKLADNGDTTNYQRTVWKECSSNPLYPQGGTWVYNRAGWCPGAPTDLSEYEITDKVKPGDSVSLDYGVVSGSGDSRYDPSTQLVSYGAPNFTRDAAVISIQRPSDRIEFGRWNPGCDLPIAVIQNTGSAPLTSLNIEYYTAGGPHRQYKWTGHLNFTDTTQVVLPVDSMSFWETPDTSNIFHVDISMPSGDADEYDQNNHYTSHYNRPPIYHGTIVVNFKSNNVPEQNYYEVRDMSGKTVFSNSTFDANTTYYDSLILKPGCYSLIFHDDGENGIAFWAATADGNGYLRLRQDTKTGKILTTINPDFGKFIQYDFSIASSPLGVNDEPVRRSLGVYPNPAHGVLKLNMEGYTPGMYVVEIVDATSRVMRREQRFTDATGRADADVPLTNIPPGSYHVCVTSGASTTVQPFVVE